jgi:hypothetical protein
VEVAGTGAKARLTALAQEVAKFLPGGAMKLKIEVCGKLGGGGNVATPLRAAQLASVPASLKSSSALQTLLESVLASGAADKMATAANALHMDGSHISQGLDAISTLAAGDLPFGSGAAARLIGILPLPPGIASFISNPASILQKAPEALQYAINQLCSQNLFGGELSQVAASACSLRNQVPSGAQFLSILQGLNGLPTTIGSIKSDLQGACSAVKAILPAKVTIPSESVDFPLGIGTVQVFPGFSKSLFTGIAAGC